MKVQVSDIVANPFRDIVKNKPVESKVDELKESISSTGLWKGIRARKVNGKVEIAFGHHRLKALQELGWDQVDLDIEDLSDSDMLQLLSRENSPSYTCRSEEDVDIVRKAVQGYADGKIELPGEVDKKTSKNQLRYAPGFTMGVCALGGNTHPYTITMLKEFLGWGKPRVRHALDTLELQDEGVLQDNTLIGLDSEQEVAILKETKKSVTPYKKESKTLMKAGNIIDAEALEGAGQSEAQYVANTLVAELKSTELHTHQIPTRAGQLRSLFQTKKKSLPDINNECTRIAKTIENFLDLEEKRNEKLQQILNYKEHLSEKSRVDLLSALGTICDFANEHREVLNK